MSENLSRRGFLGAISAFGAWLASPRAWAAESRSTVSGEFRFVHLTDIHVQPELKATEGLIQCLKVVENLRPKPDFILTGGDLVRDVFNQSAARAKTLFTLLKKTFADHTSLPVRHCLGNHDVFGWGGKRGVTPETPLYGKAMFLEELGLSQTYYSFDHKGWRFYVLDSIQPSTGEKLYQGYIDDAQFDWLSRSLKEKPAAMPACVVTHIPIMSVTVFNRPSKETGYEVLANSMCRDAQKVTQLLAAHNVKLALSGHIHEIDRCEYRGITFICDGAVSGAWWKGPHKGFDEGFGVIDVNRDGSFRHEYRTYGWKAVSADQAQWSGVDPEADDLANEECVVA